MCSWKVRPPIFYPILYKILIFKNREKFATTFLEVELFFIITSMSFDSLLYLKITACVPALKISFPPLQKLTKI